MKNNGILSFLGSILGKIAPDLALNLMFVEDESKYNFEESVERFEKSVKAHGWKMPMTHDLQETMKDNGKTVKPIKVFELCHPDHAEKILKRGKERIVTSLMPCRVSIYEKHNGKVYVSRMNSGLMAKPMGGVIDEVMSVASKENEEILKAIIKS